VKILLYTVVCMLVGALLDRFVTWVGREKARLREVDARHIRRMK
jgi:hypothetical protein